MLKALSHPGSRVPYRDHKLTFLLKDCLGGSSSTLMLTAVVASSSQYRETHNSLKFATQTSQVRVASKLSFGDKLSIDAAQYGRVKEELDRVRTQLLLRTEQLSASNDEGEKLRAVQQQLRLHVEQIEHVLERCRLETAAESYTARRFRLDADRLRFEVLHLKMLADISDYDQHIIERELALRKVGYAMCCCC